MRAGFFVLVLYTALFARENPFFPASKVPTPNYSTNSVKQVEPFKNTEITLPDSVRILKSVTLTCENIDGSITKKEIHIDKSIDWHNKIIIAQKGINGIQSKKERYKKLASLKFISFYASEKKLKIKSKDKLLRDFKLVKPNRVVLDFKRDADFRTFTFKGRGAFKKLTIGNHTRYYRVVIELDGVYTYRIASFKDGYLLILE
ncbi:FIG00638667: hypothetical protein [hydrothermal vent metagenome]|uniref:AMIN domain-containing protein n=1 Tax=hydrothermal vent metagenome TaxID=652676 RepID=A0A1W1C219_9ZZZZ